MKIMKKLFYILIVIITIFPLFLLEIKVDANELDSSQSIYPNDPLLDEQWGLRAIRAFEGWKYEHDASNITIAIIDSGVNYNHEDLKGNFSSSLHKTFLNLSGDVPYGSIGHHGTEIAGIIGAKGNNGIGISGVCWNANIISLKDGQEGDPINRENLINAINYANEIGVDIINLSQGWNDYQGRYEYNDLDVYNAMKKFNGLIVCSAGNEGKNIDIYSHYPTNYDLDNIIVVGGMNSDYTPWIGSNYGKNNVDIFAPSNAFTTKNDAILYGYTEVHGTSFAAPFVTGALALLMAHHERKGNKLSALKAKEKLLNSAKKSYSLKDYCVTGGYLDLPDLLHKHEYMYEYYNKKQHRRYCLNCEDSAYENHNWTRVMEYPMQSIPNSFDPNVRMIYECVGCGARSYGPILGDII